MTYYSKKSRKVSNSEKSIVHHPIVSLSLDSISIPVIPIKLASISVGGKNTGGTALSEHDPQKIIKL